MPHTSCCMSDHAHCMSMTTYRIWHTACRIPCTSSGGASSSSSSSTSTSTSSRSSSSSNSGSGSSSSSSRHTSCHIPHAANPITHTVCPRPQIAYGTLHAAYHRLVAMVLVVVVVVVVVVAVVVGILRPTNLMLHIRSRTPHMQGDNRRQRETTGDKTTSEPKKPTTPTNTRLPT